MPTIWKMSSTRAFIPVRLAPPSKSSRPIGVKNSSGSGLRPIFLAASVPTKRAGAPVSTRKLNGPLPSIRTRTRKWFVSVIR